MEKISLVKLFKKHIKGTKPKAPIVELTILLCNLTNAVQKASNLKGQKVHITTKVLKHLYDSKPAEEFDFILRNVFKVIKFPDSIYKNKGGKRGDYCFVKNINDDKYLASIETFIEEDENDKETEINCVVTMFRMRKERYLDSYKLLWSWKGDNPSS